jgi:hypothetical protein
VGRSLHADPGEVCNAELGVEQALCGTLGPVPATGAPVLRRRNRHQRDATAGSSSMPSRRVKKEEPKEEECEQLSPGLEKGTRPWWVEHQEL